VGLERRQLDITDPDAVAEAIEAASPEVVFNCAAFHQLDACEDDLEAARAVNVAGVGNLRRACGGARLVHVSTNYVFDGSRDPTEGGYSEDDRPDPIQNYGLSKFEGEVIAGPEALIVRTAGLYGRAGSASKGGNFVDRMLEREGEIRMVADQLVNPTSTADLAAAMLDAWQQGLVGIVHLVNHGSCSWLEFTEAILELGGRENPLTPVGTDPEATPRRPLNGALVTNRPVKAMRPWRDALSEYISGR
jgi:dTDP-4-dehydrorhamnose reductase